jgi:hypothetical protein
LRFGLSFAPIPGDNKSDNRRATAGKATEGAISIFRRRD